MAKKSAKKNSKKTTPKPVAQPIDPTLEDLRELYGNAETQDRSGSDPTFLPQNGITFRVEDATIGPVKLQTGEEVNVIRLKLIGLNGDNENKKHTESEWLNLDDRDNIDDPRWKINKAKTDIEILGGVWPTVDSKDPVGEIAEALTVIIGAIGIGDAYRPKKFPEGLNLKILDRAEANDDDVPDSEPDEPSITKDDIKAMSEEEMDQAAKDNDIDPDDYATYDLLAEKLIALLC